MDPGFATGEFVCGTPSLDRDRLSRLMEAAPRTHRDAQLLGPAGQSHPTINLSVFRHHPACAAVMSAVEAQPELCREIEFANPTGRQARARELAFQLVDDHVSHFVGDAVASGEGNVASERSRELQDAVESFAKTR